MKKITGFLIDVENNCAAPVTIDKGLDGYYNILNCDCIDIVRRKIGSKHKEYEIVCDDEALLKDNPKISALDSGLNIMLCGNLFITRFDGMDDIESLEKQDIEYIKQYIRCYPTRKYPIPYPMLVECDY